MKEKIKEVQDYFKKSIVDGDYKIVEVKENSIVILVGGYAFSLWTASKIYGLSLYSDSFMNFKFNEAEKVAIYNNLKQAIMKHKRDVLIVEKKAQLKRLEEEIAEDEQE